MENSFQSRTPSDVIDYTTRDVIQLIKDTRNLGVSPAKRVALIEMLYTVLGFDLTNDIVLMLASEPTAKLCLATAGGGKTTAANIQIILEKIFFKGYDGGKLKGTRCLCLMYNQHNVEPFKKKHVEMVDRIRSSGVSGFDVDSDVRATTLHSYANMWCNEYRIEADLIGCRFIQEYEVLDIMKMAIKTISKKDVSLLDMAVDSGAETLYGLYTYKLETLSDYEDLKKTDKFIDSGLSINTVKDIFELYEKVKKRKHVYSYEDMLYKFYIILQDQKIRSEIQSYYDYVVADEVQDFTPLMFEILRLLVSDNTPLMCIGDEDQSIYGFRGANIYNALAFTDMFEDAASYSLVYNRRCAVNIVEQAKKIVECNKLRFSKSIKATRDGGNVQLIPYNSVEGQILKVANKLEKYDSKELHSTVICTRDKKSTLLIAQELADRNIPCYVTKGYHPYSHELYRHVFDVLKILSRPLDNYAQLNLYKVLPIKRDELYNLLKYDPVKQEFHEDAERRHFAKIDYGTFLTRKNFKEALDELIEIAGLIRDKNMNTYFDRIMELINRWFWLTKKNYNNDTEIDDIFEKKMHTMFNVPHTFDFVNREFLSKKEKYRKYDTYHKGVNISTFHSLKGLEFKNVFMMYLDNDLFPNYPLIDSKEYSESLKESLKEAETRLCYVAMTRAKDNLYMYYSESNPSLYIRILKEGLSLEDALAETEASNITAIRESNTIAVKTLEAFEDILLPQTVEANKDEESIDSDFLTLDMLEPIDFSSHERKFTSISSETEDDLFSALNKQTILCDDIINSVQQKEEENLMDMFSKIEEAPINTKSVLAKPQVSTQSLFGAGSFLDKVSNRFGG